LQFNIFRCFGVLLLRLNLLLRDLAPNDTSPIIASWSDKLVMIVD